MACVVLFLAAFAAQGPIVFCSEFTGEDEVLFAVMSLEWIRVGLGIPGAFEKIQFFYYPPLQSLISAPLVWFFGPTEWSMRLPGAFMASLAAPLLFLIMRGAGASSFAQWIAAGMIALHGVLANHAYALTCGLFTGASAICAFGIREFVEQSERARQSCGWMIASMGWVLMAATLPDAYFHLPVLLALYAWKRRFRADRMDIVGFLLLVLWIVAYGYFGVIQPALRDSDQSGTAHKIRLILSDIGTFRVRELVSSFAAGSSWPAVLLSLILVPLGWREASTGLRAIVFFFAFPLALWTFVFGYSNVRSAHMLLAFPAYAALWALGASRMARVAQTISPQMAITTRAAIICAFLVGLWQSCSLYWIKSPRLAERSPSWLVEKSVYPQGRRLEEFGQSAASVWIQRRTPEDVSVLSTLGGAFADYYCKRPSWRIEDLERYLADPSSAREAQARYFAVHIHPQTQPLRERLASSGATLSAEIRVGDRAVLSIYDLWREPRDPALIDAKKGRKRFEEIHRAWWMEKRRLLRKEVGSV